MAIRAGSGKGAADRSGEKPGSGGGRGQPILRGGQARKPLQPIENPFPEKKEFRLGQYVVVEEKDDYLVCEGYDPNAKYPFTEITPPAFRKIKVAKPLELQRTPWDGNSFDIGGTTYTYEYSDDEKGVRTASWTDDNGNDQEEEQRINLPYVVSELESQIIIAVEIRKSAAVDGMDFDDEDGGRLSWMDLNVGGRHWKGPQVGTGLVDAQLTTSLSAASSPTSPTTATATFLESGESFLLTNRSTDASGDAGTYIVVAPIMFNGSEEWRPVWVDC